MNKEKLKVEIDNDNYGFLIVIIFILFLNLIEIGNIHRMLKGHFEDNPKTETIQTTEVQE